jgi:sulfonate transport system substrate-binding protein
MKSASRSRRNNATRRTFIAATTAALFTALGVVLPAAQAETGPAEVRLDYAFYSPPSLVIRKFGWADQEFAKSNTKVRWVQSAGSNRALEFLAADAVDFGSTAGLAAVLSRANGNPIKTVFVYSRPEWTALAVPKDSPIKSLADLKGKKIAATKGTDPYLFTLRSLQLAGLHKNDVELVHLQHADGRVALEQKRVDAWAGLDPLLAASELEAGTRIIYRNVSFNTYGFLNTTEKFAQKYPEAVDRTVRLYERARVWIQKNPEEAAKLLSEEAKISLDVAKRQLARTGFDESIPTQIHRSALTAASSILLEEGLVKPGTDVARVIDELVPAAQGAKVAAAIPGTPASAIGAR